MMKPKKCIAMLLAGGQGSRLSILTQNLAKPALPFGGKYRIIDFALSNCTNSDIQTVGVLTQYKPLVLNSYIAGGQPWDLDRNEGGVYVLPPYVREKELGQWYKGTANAIYQNMEFIEDFQPDDVLVLSGDHIYTMDYSQMLSFHRKNDADATIAVIEVPWKEAGRFGIMRADERGRIVEFAEKPKRPMSNQASMGVYMFKWEMLRKYLIEDEANPASSNDFGKNVIPAMLGDGCRMFAYAFQGYWKDVGTIESFWEANMDLIQTPPVLQMDSQWRIYSRNAVQPPHYTAPEARVTSSMVTEGCNIFGTAVHSILSPRVYLEKDCEVVDSILMPGVRVGKGSRIYKTIVGSDTVIGDHCILGSCEQKDRPVSAIGDRCRIPDGAVIPAGNVLDQPGIDRVVALEGVSSI